jgi:hypothetical protein
MFKGGAKSDSEKVRKLNRLLNQTFLLLLLISSGALEAGPITVPNASFESPATPFVSLIFDSWQRTPQPVWWDENASGPWTNLTGIFKNTAPGSVDHIDNCDGNQAAWLFANPDTGFFQDYDSMAWNDPAPTHAFDAKFEAGKFYRLTVGVIGGGYSMLPETPLEASFYYRDAASNKVVVAATTITYSSAYFSNRTQLVNFTVTTPVVRLDDPWAGLNIGIQFLSVVTPELAGGYWDLDNVRLTSLLAPALLNPVHSSGQFRCILQSEPGFVIEMLASTNLALPDSNWISLATLSNVTGSIPFIDTSANFDQRFYRARQLP